MGQNCNSRPSNCSSSISSFSTFLDFATFQNIDRWCRNFLLKFASWSHIGLRPKLGIDPLDLGDQFQIGPIDTNTQDVECERMLLHPPSRITDLILHPAVHYCIIQSISWYIPSYMVVGGNLRHNKVASGRQGVGVGGLLATSEQARSWQQARDGHFQS